MRYLLCCISVIISLVSCHKNDEEIILYYDELNHVSPKEVAGETIEWSRDIEYSTSVNYSLKFFCSRKCAGRRTGTKGAKRAGDYILNSLDEIGIEPIIQHFTFGENKDDHRNLVVRIQGESDSVIVVGAHYDGPFESDQLHSHMQAANDNASGTSCLLYLCELMANEKTYYSVQLCFWDAEEVTSGTFLNGSRAFVNSKMYDQKTKYYINIDGVGYYDEENTIIVASGNEQLLNNAKSLVSSITTDLEITYRNDGKIKNNLDSYSFYEKGCPYYYYTNLKNHHLYNHSSNDVIENMSVKKIEDVALLTRDVIRNWRQK